MSGFPLPEAPQIERHTAAGEVARVLRQRILGGQYREGEFIRQEAIAEELGVSRLPVREALALLEAEGFVLCEKYRGALVPKLSIGELREIYNLRAMLEPYILDHALPHLTAGHIARAREQLALMRVCKDVRRWAELNRTFHQILYEPSDLPLAMQRLEQLWVRGDRYLRMQRVLSVETRNESDAAHQRLLDLISSGNAAEAVLNLKNEISRSVEDVASMFARVKE